VFKNGFGFITQGNVWENSISDVFMFTIRRKKDFFFYLITAVEVS